MLLTKGITAWKPVPCCAGFLRSPDLLQSGSSRQPAERLEMAFASLPPSLPCHPISPSSSLENLGIQKCRLGSEG